jgi:hypothetical protein
LIFSKADAGRFPVEGEVEDLFAALKPKTPSDEPPKEQSSGGRAGVLGRLTDKFRN